MDTTQQPRDQQASPPSPPGVLRLWLFRLAAVLLLPAAVLVALEIVLGVSGFGAPAEFLVPSASRDGVATTNQRFGWRFFPAKIARSPVPFELDVEPASGVYRIFVVGGSTARGTPEPGFSVGRILETLLEARYPERRFEVKNAAMTAINSHVVLEIVRDLADFDPDLFVVYLGHNEIVGPYGAATVFNPFSPNLRLIRASAAVKGSRLGQLLDRAVGSTAESHGEWRGMEMFLEQRVAADDPRLGKVYEHLRANLEDVVRIAHGAGARVVLSTVAANVRGQPPFASLHREGLSESEKERFDALRVGFLERLKAADGEGALAQLDEALAVDDSYAETHYSRGQMLHSLGRAEEARESFLMARDLDALRFRADRRINEVIREVAANEGVALVDAERFFLDGAGLTSPLPGRALFYEHVHLAFAGTYALAGALLGEVEKLLPTRSGEGPATPPPSVEEVAERLVFTPFDAAVMENEILQIVTRPPFSGQIGHSTDLAARRQRLRELRRALDGGAWHRSVELYERRLADRPDDLLTRRRYAELLASRGEAERAAEHWRRLVERIGDVLAWHDGYATALGDAGRVEEAVAVFESSRELFPYEAGKILVNLGLVLEHADRDDEAAAAYRRALEADSELPAARFNLATLAVGRGDLDTAVALYRELVELHPDFAPGHHNLGVALEHQGDVEGAAASYRLEIEASPEDPQGHNSLGLALERQGQPEEALRAYVTALHHDSGYAPALFNLADVLLSRGYAAEAAAQYARGLAVEPGNAQARMNRTRALLAAGDAESAAGELERLRAALPGDPRLQELEALFQGG